MKRGRKVGLIILGLGLMLVGVLLIYFNISYSPLKKDFYRERDELIKTMDTAKKEVFTIDELDPYPTAIKKYIIKAGYIGKPKMAYVNLKFNDANFIQALDKRALVIDYDQYNFAYEPIRIALITSSLYGIPFEGYDAYKNAAGSMKGVIGKNITLFNETGPAMDQGALVTYLAESLFVPASIFNGYISYEEIDPYNVCATISYEGQEASGIFTFNEAYELVKFYTADRAMVADDGTITKLPWSEVISEYKVNEDGIQIPYKCQAIWHYPEGDLVYFDGLVSEFYSK